MEKELCLKFLVHIHKYSTEIMKKDYINEVDLTYINNEIDNFKNRLGSDRQNYDKNGLLNGIEKIDQETKVDKVSNILGMILRSRTAIMNIGKKDSEHEKRFDKISEFREKLKKIIFIIENEI